MAVAVEREATARVRGFEAPGGAADGSVIFDVGEALFGDAAADGVGPNVSQ